MNVTSLKKTVLCNVWHGLGNGIILASPRLQYCNCCCMLIVFWDMPCSTLWPLQLICCLEQTAFCKLGCIHAALAAHLFWCTDFEWYIYHKTSIPVTRTKLHRLWIAGNYIVVPSHTWPAFHSRTSSVCILGKNWIHDLCIIHNPLVS